MNSEKMISREDVDSANWFLSALESPSQFQRPWRTELHRKRSSPRSFKMPNMQVIGHLKSASFHLSSPS